MIFLMFCFMFFYVFDDCSHILRVVVGEGAGDGWRWVHDTIKHLLVRVMRAAGPTNAHDEVLNVFTGLLPNKEARERLEREYDARTRQGLVPDIGASPASPAGAVVQWGGERPRWRLRAAAVGDGSSCSHCRRAKSRVRGHGRREPASGSRSFPLPLLGDCGE